MLPYTYYEGEGYVLLGLENRIWDNLKWTKKAQTKWVWGDFGGSCDEADRSRASEYQTTFNRFCAARECAEETGFVFGNQLPLAKICRKDQPGNSMFKNSIDYLIKQVTYEYIYAEPEEPNQKAYTQYFVKVEYIDPVRLNKEAVKNAHEKRVFRWIKVSELLIALDSPDATGFYRLSSIKTDNNKIKSNKLFPPFANSLKHHRGYLEALVNEPCKPAVVSQEEIKQLYNDYTNLLNVLQQLYGLLPN